MIEVVAGIIMQNDLILIARRAPHKSHPGKWEFPGGKIEKFETPETALERELKEEFTIQTKTGRFITSTIHDYGTFQINLLAYYSDYISGDFILIDHDKITWVKVQELLLYDLAEADIFIVKTIINLMI